MNKLTIGVGMTHTKCGGLGIIEDENGKAEVCVECMGSGIESGEVEFYEC